MAALQAEVGGINILWLVPFFDIKSYSWKIHRSLLSNKVQLIGQQEEVWLQTA